MKRYTAALFLFVVTVLAQAEVPVSQKIVAVSFNAAVLQTAEAQKEMGALKARFAPRQAQLQTLNDEVESLRKQLSDPANKLSETEMTARQRSLESKEKQLQRQAEDFKNDSDSESQQAFQRVAQKVYAFLQTYAQQHGYSAVIERGSDAAPVVWFAAADMDITDQLVKAYNAQSSGVSTGSAAKSALPDTPLPHQ
jgi:outer membrane protein